MDYYKSNEYLDLNKPLFPSPYDGTKFSPFHLLYPGRRMSIRYEYPSGSNYEIPNESPEVARRDYETKQTERMNYARDLEKLARSQGGGDDEKVAVHPAVEPEALTEDPDLKYVPVRDIPNPNAVEFPPPIYPPPETLNENLNLRRNVSFRENFGKETDEISNDGIWGWFKRNGKILKNIAFWIIIILFIITFIIFLFACKNCSK